MRYAVIDANGIALWQFGSICDCQRAIAGEFHVEFRKVDEFDAPPRHAESLGAYHQNGHFFEIIRQAS